MQRLPFIRVLIPFIIGLLVSFNNVFTQNTQAQIILLIGSALIFFITLKFNFNKVVQLIFFDVSIFLFATLLVHFTKSQNLKNSLVNKADVNTEITYLASLSEIAVEKQNSYKCELKINGIVTHNKIENCEGTVIAYIKKPIDKKILQPHKTLLVKSKLQLLSSPKNPMEFDYKNYLSNKNIFHISFIESKNVLVFDSIRSNLNPLIAKGLSIKYALIEFFRNNGLNKGAFSICSALLTGYDDEIDKSVIDSFSHSGTLHVLSVSGLHVGFIFLLLNFVFNVFDKNNKWKIFRFILITFVLWFFALITGFSAPVLRSVIMFNFLGVGKLFRYHHPKNQLNVLFFSAFVLLLFNPNLINDVGFLLSYSAMIGILFFVPLFQNLIQTENKVLKYILESFSVSIAATLTTLPFTLFYFKQFPIWFFVANLFIVPLSSVILILTLISLLKFQFIVQLINCLVYAMIRCISIFGTSKFSFIDTIDFNLMDAICLTGLVFLSVYIFNERKYVAVVYTFLLLIVWQVISLFQSYEAKSKNWFVVYNVKHQPCVAVKNKSEAIYSNYDSTTFKYSLKTHFVSFNNAALVARKFNFMKCKEVHVLLLDSSNSLPREGLIETSTLVLSNNYKLNENLLSHLNKVKLIICDATNSLYNISRTENLCAKFGIELYNTKLNGAFVQELK